ncbi:MAG TPA: cyclic nucleotide-binding domain-containing protein [Cytophagales bacterium]|jgi:CRP/FNR family cyclic AMP-dependent transcriptional regulator|nr:cyclic nucleotide-binding domain-containing protein [Cytophagales bacterium]
MRRFFKKEYSLKELNFFRYLSRVQLFEKLNYDEMALFRPYFYLRTYKADEAVFFRNDPSNALYLVKSGKVALSIDIKDNFETLMVIRSGDEFGENCLLKQSHRLYSALVVSESSDIYVLPKVNIEDIFSTHPKIKAKMMESLSEMYNDFNSRLFKSYKTSFGFFELNQAFKS